LIHSFEDLLASLPEDQINGKMKDELKTAYDFELEQIKRYINQAQNPQAVLLPFNQSGSQFIANFWVNDLALPAKNQFNWHLQNTSQWLYAGCILVQNGRVSLHH